MGLLRLAGDAICVPAAQAFIEAYREVLERSFLPEPDESEAELLTKFEEVTQQIKKEGRVGNYCGKKTVDLSRDAYGVQTIDRMIAVLEFLAESEEYVSMQDVADALGLNRSTTHRYLICLTRHKMALRTVKGRYLCAPAMEKFLDSRKTVK